MFSAWELNNKCKINGTQCRRTCTYMWNILYPLNILESICIFWNNFSTMYTILSQRVPYIQISNCKVTLSLTHQKSITIVCLHFMSLNRSACFEINMLECSTFWVDVTNIRPRYVPATSRSHLYVNCQKYVHYFVSASYIWSACLKITSHILSGCCKDQTYTWIVRNWSLFCVHLLNWSSCFDITS